VSFREGVEQTHGKFRLGVMCSVFQSELIAIKKSIEYVKEILQNSESIIRVLILTDSQSAIAAIKQFNSTHPIVFDIRNLIKSCDKVVFHLKWIRGHTGVEGNERADELAKEAADLNTCESIYDSFPLSFAKKYFKSISITDWEKSWRLTTKAYQTKQFFPTINERLSLKTLKPNFLITQYLSGHGNFRSYLKRFHLSDNDVCDCGQAIETPLHVILDCVLFSDERHQFLNEIHRTGHSTLPPNKLLKDENIFTELIIFLKGINASNN
jgi:ribonuclease HI